MPWLALSLEVEAATCEAFSDALLELGALSVTEQDADAGTAEERPRYAEPGWDSPAAWTRNRLSVLLDPHAEPVQLVAAAAAACGIDPPRVLETSRVDDADWVRQTQSQFGPMQVGERLWIVPSWHEPPRREALVVRLDPGLAFGTGSHPTTRLVLRWLERGLRAGERVLDYGCGSGILALAAARLGAAAPSAVDIDSQALAAAAENARRNAVALNLYLPDELPPDPYDVIVANILAAPLVALAPVLAARCRSGARLALSGILEAQAAEVIEAYSAAFDAGVAGEDGGWVLIEARRR